MPVLAPAAAEIELPDGTFMRGPLLGSQQPRFRTVPERHREKQPDCLVCQRGTDYACGCGDYKSRELLDWAPGFGYDLDPWQDDWLSDATGVTPDGRWAAFECLCICCRQNGKNPVDLSVDILTDRGWKTMGTVRPGDRVYGSDGYLTRVVACSPVYTSEPCYEVSFTDGSAYVVGRKHLWHVRGSAGRSSWQDVPTEELAKDYALRRPDTGHMSYRYRVRCDAVPDTPKADLPIDPYLLGYWLGDGSKNSPSIVVGHKDAAWVSWRLYKAGARKGGWAAVDAPPEGTIQTDGRSLVMQIRLDSAMRDGFESRCRRLGIWGNKGIPEMYLTASADQRRELLAGLMDSDGSVTVTNKSPQAEFTTSFPQLADGFLQLARSLGIRVARKNGPVVVDGKRYRDRARFLWTPTFCPFELPRKAGLWRLPVSRRHEVMSITGIRSVEPIPIRCIQVEAPDGVFLLGRNFTPTHNSCLEVRQLGGMYLFGEGLAIHSAHEFKAAREHFRRISDTINGYDELRRRVKSISTSHGEESIELRPKATLIFGSSGRQVRKSVSARLRFLARSRGSGRAFTADAIYYDEAMIISEDAVSASLPTLRAVPNPQVYYTASAGYHDSTQLAAVRRRMIRHDPTLFGTEWSINPHLDDCPRDEILGRKTNRYVVCLKHDDRDDPRAWAKSNPAFGTRIRLDHFRKELATMPLVAFDRELLGVGDWPPEEEAWEIVTEEAWQACAMPDPGGAVRPLAFAWDVAEDLASATIASCWDRPEPEGVIITDKMFTGRPTKFRAVLEIPRGCSREGVAWVIPRLLELRKKWRPLAICGPTNGPGASLIDDAEKAGLEVLKAGSADEAAALALFRTKVAERGIVHLGKEQAPAMHAAIASATTRDVGDGGKALKRRDAETDISPATAPILAHWALNRKRRSYDPRRSVA